ncbi:hypothetical protein BCR37DRAFT_375410 [Protomyces lactucae-debilis]|uniref:Response regulatory domain-containing protein n=1 Tax=Protomyces lactucae-debilis TaxID=2754530 RepID=A0A1Y2FWK4_PROLT|nr:uncharacterized protein BCR37DRAFT_375410 [Protomyces lactucae-debilis]ORY87556.1 hypothetical protein BCR37DRAFT_375410 [Protomyces lactucae-debilis]
MAFEWCTVVAISGGGEEEETEMKAAGADYFFQRPFTGKDLKRFLAQFEKDLIEARSATRSTSVTSISEPSRPSALKNELSSA